MITNIGIEQRKQATKSEKQSRTMTIKVAKEKYN